MRIAICDDNKKEIQQVEDLIRELTEGQTPECFSAGTSFLEAAAGMPPFSLVFLDVYLMNESGIDIAAKLREISSETAIVFLTASTEHAIAAFSLQALHYLVKPVTAEDIEEVFRRFGALQKKKRSVLQFSSGKNQYFFYQDEIVYLQCDSHIVDFIQTNGRVSRIRITLAELAALLDKNFLKINRSVLVNMDYVEHMGTDTVILQNGAELEIARRQKTAVRKTYMEYLFDEWGGE